MDTPRLRRIAARIAARIASERIRSVGEVCAAYEARVPLGRLPRVDRLVWAATTLVAPEDDILHGTVLHLDARGLRSPH